MLYHFKDQVVVMNAISVGSIQIVLGGMQDGGRTMMILLLSEKKG
jgi:hypothetical protein